MEIGVFSQCVKDLILTLDSVDIPGLGVFFAEDAPATVSDKGNTINPPTRTLYFRRDAVSPREDNAFLQHICKKQNVPFEQAQVELDWCLGRIHSELSGNKSCILPGLGEMKSSSEGEYFFIPVEDLQICPESFGLEPVCVKITAESTPAPQPVTAPDPDLAPQIVTVSNPMDSELETGEQEPTPDPTPNKSGKKVALIIVLILLLLIIGAAVAAYYLYPAETDAFLNTLLYTPEELEILGM